MKFKKGSCIIIPSEEYSNEFHVEINESAPTFEEQQDLCVLFNNAHDTVMKCDLLPSELLEQRDELVEMLEKCINWMDKHKAEQLFNSAKELLTKIKTA